MSETKIRAFRMSESAHAKLVEGVEQLKFFSGTFVSRRQVLEELVNEYLPSYMDKYMQRSHELVDLKDRVKKLEERQKFGRRLIRNAEEENSCGH
tara:strand:+ start:266 stop:550 length:285 start_codon:yes stop_codon:yes gene_type:complete